MIRVPGQLGLGEDSLPALQIADFLLSLHVVFPWYVSADREISLLLFLQTSNSIMRVLPSKPYLTPTTSPELHLQIRTST